MLTQDEKDSREKGQEQRAAELTRSTINEANSILDEFAENPEKLTYLIATEFFNRFPFKQEHIISIYFKYIKGLSIWMEIYRASKEDEPSKKFALNNIKSINTDSQSWISLFESEKEEEIQQIAVNKVGENSSSIDDWIDVYKFSSYGTEISKNSLINMKKYATTHEDWKKIYNIAPFDSKTKNLALEKLMETAKPLEEAEAEDEHSENMDIKSEDWLDKYNKIRDFHAKHKDLALINKYIFSNFSAK